MDRSEAEQLAIKRNAHKGKALWNKEWTAYNKADGSWDIKLVDSVRAEKQARQKQYSEAVQEARNVIRHGGTLGDLRHAVDKAAAAIQNLQAELGKKD